MQVLTISGNLGKDAELRQTQGGDDVLTFNLGVQNGYGRDAGTIWYRCSIWGQRAKSLNGKLRKGDKAFVSGALTIGEYQGKPQYDVRVAELDFTSKGERPAQDSRGGGGADSHPDDLDDNVPFVTSGPVRGHRNF
jgi:single-strand DNA-binding protein